MNGTQPAADDVAARGARLRALTEGSNMPAHDDT